jgi:hypothetical protein
VTHAARTSLVVGRPTAGGLDTASTGDQGFERLAVVDTLVPGYYWRLKRDHEIPDQRFSGGSDHKIKYEAGTVHLLLDVFEFDGTVHSVTLLEDPLRGTHEFKLLVAEFLDCYEPAADGEQVREQAQLEVMQAVTDLQDEMMRAQAEPMALPDLRAAAEKAVEEFERQEVARASQEAESTAQRTQDLRRIHRRAARRAAEAGNPLVPRATTISDSVEAMIAGGIDSEGLRELTFEARRRTAIAEATSKWLHERTREIANRIEALTPFYAEKGRVAMARASKAFKLVKSLTAGLTSLKLYTGDGIDVHTVREGNSAPTDEPLTLVQGKRYVDEEMAVWADVNDDFDFSQLPRFLDLLRTDKRLLDQVFPAQRCVVAAAATRRRIDYAHRNLSAFEEAMNDMRNKLVFLMVRDGENVHVVHSSEPSHEALNRLFPSKEDVQQIFRKFDGSRIGIQDIAFSKATEQHDVMSVCFLRVLVLLCGLDHRLQLFGDFYPREEAMRFMKPEFQARYMKFLYDEEDDYLLGDQLPPLRQWLEASNQAVQSGSRIVLRRVHVAGASPHIARRRLEVLWQDIPGAVVAGREGKQFFVKVPVTHRYDDVPPGSEATVWLTGPEIQRDTDHFLCIDRVSLPVLRRYVYSRTSRAADISWLRTLRRAEQVIERDLADQAQLRAYLRSVATEHGVVDAAGAEDAIDGAIATWRAAHRGAPAPLLEDRKGVDELLTLIYPGERIAIGLRPALDALVEREGMRPLRFVRTGKNRLALYVEANDEDRRPYAAGVCWGWVKRLTLKHSGAGKGTDRLTVATSSLVWLEKDKPLADEQVLREWPGLHEWVHPLSEPCRLEHLSLIKQRMDAALQLREVLQQGRAGARGRGLPEWFTEAIGGQRRLWSYEVPWILVPVGVYQGERSATARFLSMGMPYPAFVARYGAPEEVAQMRARLMKTRSTTYDSWFGLAQEWSLVETDRPVRDWLLAKDSFVGDIRPPVWASIRSHERGGAKRRQYSSSHGSVTRAQRRAANGMPYANEVAVKLSMNRAIETLAGVNPRMRREFYRNVEDRMRMADFHGWDEEGKRKRRAERLRRFEKPQASFALSGLVWDAASGRSVANTHFSVTK